MTRKFDLSLHFHLWQKFEDFFSRLLSKMSKKLLSYGHFCSLLLFFLLSFVHSLFFLFLLSSLSCRFYFVTIYNKKRKYSNLKFKKCKKKSTKKLGIFVMELNCLYTHYSYKYKITMKSQLTRLLLFDWILRWFYFHF